MVFVATCPWCGQVLDVIPADGSWREAEAWAYLAAQAHRSECPAREDDTA